MGYDNQYVFILLVGFEIQGLQCRTCSTFSILFNFEKGEEIRGDKRFCYPGQFMPVHLQLTTSNCSEDLHKIAMSMTQIKCTYSISRGCSYAIIFNLLLRVWWSLSPHQMTQIGKRTQHTYTRVVLFF